MRDRQVVLASLLERQSNGMVQNRTLISNTNRLVALLSIPADSGRKNDLDYLSLGGRITFQMIWGYPGQRKWWSQTLSVSFSVIV